MKKLIPILALTSVAAVWGSTFFMIHDHVLEEVPAPDFLTVRFIIAAVAACLLWFKELLAADWKTLALGFGLGVFYGLGQLFQTWGLNLTTPATSGFITAMYVVMVPFVALILFRERFKPVTWLWMLLAALGLAVLSLQGLSFGIGELLTLLGAVFFALQVATLGVVSPGRSAGALTAMQMVATSDYASYIRVQNDVPQTLVSVNHVLFPRALVNLLQNSARAVRTRTERRILLRVEAEDGVVRFTVADNGVGISPERQKSVWGRGTSGEGSSGLGLAFVRSIVDRLGGEVTLCSKVNEGTRITITIEEAAE